LSVSLNINTLLNGQNVDVSNKTQVDQNQNPAICGILTKMFPPSGNTNVSLINEAGVALGTEARVLCNYTLPAPGGYQVRRFKVDLVGGVPAWDVCLTTSTSAIVANLVY